MNPKRKRVITLLSIIIPLLVAILGGVKIESSYDFTFLPRIYAGINFTTFLVLIAAFISIKKGNKILHERFIKTAIVLTSLFLILYSVYHITTVSTTYGGDGMMKYVYFFILISHILLSIIVIPLVLLSIGWAMEGNFVKHKKFAKVAMPMWLYVALTGVLVYLMISPYYP